MKPVFDNIPDEMKAERRWVMWKYEERDGKRTKAPYRPAKISVRASSTNPGTWTSFQTAQEKYRAGGTDGIGFVLGDGWTGIDLDKCFNEDGVLNDVALQIVKEFGPAYTEISPSGRGLHIIFKGVKPGTRSRRDDLGIEIYDKDRYFTITGDVHAHCDQVLSQQAALEALYHRLFPENKKPEKQPSRPDSLPLGDREILNIIARSRQNAKFQKLWRGDASDYLSDSEADSALCWILAFYTDDAGQIDRMFRASGLYREKWEREDYRGATIERALAGIGNRYEPKGKAGQTSGHGERKEDDIDIDTLIEHAVAAEGKERLALIKQICQALLKSDPIEQEHYIQVMADLGLAKIGALRKQMKSDQKAQSEDEKPAIVMAEELIDEKFSCETGMTLTYHQEAWYVYNGAKHVRRSKDEIETEISAKVSREYHAGVDVDVSTALVSNIRLAMQPVVALDSRVDHPCWISKKESTETVFSVQNGLFDILSFLADEHPLMPHTSDFFTHSSLPYDYNPAATCPMWLKFLDEALPDKASRLILQEFYGLSLTHDQRFHQFLFLQGEANTGKGVAFEVLQALVGLENVSSVPLREFAASFGTETMIGKKLNINAEIPELDKVAEDVLKEITGGSTLMNYNRKYKEAITSLQRPKLAFSSNNVPNFRDRSQGVWRRMLLIRFDHVPSRPDADLVANIVGGELGGVFNWAMEGYKRLTTEKRFTDSETLKEEIAQYQRETIPAKDFLLTHTSIDPDARVATHGKTLYRYYCLWCKNEGRRAQNSVTFGRDVSANMRQQGVARLKDRYGTVFPRVVFERDERERIVTLARGNGHWRDDVLWDYELDMCYDYNDERFAELLTDNPLSEDKAPAQVPRAVRKTF